MAAAKAIELTTISEDPKNAVKLTADALAVNDQK